LLLDATAPVVAFAGSGKTHVAYEVHLTNYNVQHDAFLTRVDVISADTTLARFEGAELNALVTNPFAKDGLDNRVIEPGRGAVAFLWLTLETGARIPTALRHRITLLDGGTVEGGAVGVLASQSSPLGPPLHGADWVAAGGLSNRTPHRHALFQLDGKSRISQRFAIDWIKLGADGRPFVGSPADNRSYHAYGADVLAVANATVASIRDQVPENTPGTRAVAITLESAAGNYVILDLGGGRFAFYAHVQPGSVRVKVGDRVSRGQVIALVGNSGNSQFPHLHFHVADANSPFAAEGLPYALDSFEVLSASENWERRRNEIPLATARIRFP
jgi:murein DD-endopeptidase MepM/ murein hydrolase activator NlpD